MLSVEINCESNNLEHGVILNASLQKERGGRRLPFFLYSNSTIVEVHVFSSSDWLCLYYKVGWSSINTTLLHIPESWHSKLTHQLNILYQIQYSDYTRYNTQTILYQIQYSDYTIPDTILRLYQIQYSDYTRYNTQTILDTILRLY